MRQRFFIVTVLILCVLTAYTSAQNIYSDAVFYHTVERGQTVFSIAKMYDVKVEDIYRLNIGSEDGIRAGKQLRIPQKRDAAATTSEGYIYHTIQARETLYGVSKKYNVNGKDIIDANPGLTHETFAIGKIIRIPSNVKPEPVNEVVENTQGAKEVYYTVPSRETIYNICQRFKTSEKELLKLNPELSGGLRKGMILRIPLRINESDIPKPEEQAPGEVNAMLDSHSSKPLNASKIALLLPFNADNAERSDLSNRMVEYYEGMLLAADSFRNQGYATELFLYDIGEKTDKLQQLLRDKNDVFKSVNLIIGGWSNEQVKILSDYAGRNHIKYVIPITSKNDDVLNNAYIYQVNTPQQYLYDNASFAAAALFADHNIVFVDTQDKDEQSDFIKVFKRELNDRKISSATIVHNSSDFESKIIGALSKTKPNVVIPFSASIESLNKIKTVLRSIIQTKPEYKVTLFGYPKWQTYYKDCLDDFHELNTYIYSLFYADNIDPAVKQFYDNYKNWYSKTPMPSFPKYAMLGFDTGMFFLDALQKYGDNFENHISKMKYKSVQTGFNFERVNNWGGFINTNIYMIHFNKDFTITRSDFK